MSSDSSRIAVALGPPSDVGAEREEPLAPSTTVIQLVPTSKPRAAGLVTSKLQAHARVASKVAADKADQGFAACCYLFMGWALKLFLLEQGSFATKAVPRDVQEYLDGKRRFACTPDRRFEDYDFGFGASQPVWNERTHGEMPCLGCYPCCWLPCCCQRRRRSPPGQVLQHLCHVLQLS